VLFITGLDTSLPSKFSTTARRDIFNASPAPVGTKKLPFGGAQNPSKSVLGNHPSTTHAHSPPPHNSTSLPEIAASDQLLREMQREKDRLNRYFQSKERTAKQMEDLEKRA
jgi:hypothetical protein